MDEGDIAVIHTLGKIAISLVQVLTQLEFSLSLVWPKSFRWFIDLLKVFSMDLLGFINIGCVTQYTVRPLDNLALPHPAPCCLSTLLATVRESRTTESRTTESCTTEPCTVRSTQANLPSRCWCECDTSSCFSHS